MNSYLILAGVALIHKWRYCRYGYCMWTWPPPFLEIDEGSTPPSWKCEQKKTDRAPEKQKKQRGNVRSFWHVILGSQMSSGMKPLDEGSPCLKGIAYDVSISDYRVVRKRSWIIYKIMAGKNEHICTFCREFLFQVEWHRAVPVRLHEDAIYASKEKSNQSATSLFVL